MSQEQAIDAARVRIQRLVEEIALLTKKELPSEQFFAEFITRAVKACDARGGAVWLVGQRNAEGNSEFQLAAQVEFESSLFQSDEVQRALLLRALQECANTRQPSVLAPQHQQPDPNSQQVQLAQLQGTAPATPQNKTPYSFLHVALPLKENIVGVLQVWLQPYVTPQNYAEFAQFLGSLTGYVETHLQSRRLGTLVVETQRLQHLLKFATDLAGSLDTLEVARLAANYGRDLIGCERCSVLWLDGGKWRVLSISGQEVVEKKSTMVKAMSAFVGAHVLNEVVTLSKKELLARHGANGDSGPLAPQRQGFSDDIDLAYFDVSHVVSAVIAPVLDEEKQLVGAYFAESTNEGFFSAKESQPHRITEWLALHTGKSLIAAEDYQTLPFRTIGRRIRATRLALTGPKRKRNVFRLAVFGGIAAAILLFPWMDEIEGNCSLVPEHHVAVVPEVPGRMEKIFVREGSKVAKGDPVAQLDKRRIETELEQNGAEIRRLNAEAEKARGAGDEASAQVAQLQALAAEKQGKKLQTDLEATTLRSPIDGVVLTKDVEKHSGEFVQAGQAFAEVAALDQWDVRVEVPERDIGKIEKRLAREPLKVGFILYSESAERLYAQIERLGQISAAAEPRDTENVFLVTLEDIQLPERLQPSMRPGLSGRASIELGRKPLIVLWARDLWNWGRMRML